MLRQFVCVGEGGVLVSVVVCCCWLLLGAIAFVGCMWFVDLVASFGV